MAVVTTTKRIVTIGRRAVVLVTYALLLADCSGGATGPPRIASDVFVSRVDGSAPNEVALLSGTFDVDVAVTALERAGARIVLVDDRGTDYATEADIEAAEQPRQRRLLSPNYVADPKVLSTLSSSTLTARA